MSFAEKKIVIIGVGRVGLPLLLYLEHLGYSLVGVDKDGNMLSQLREKRMPFNEPGCENLLKQSKAIFTCNVQEAELADVIIITVGTPLLSHIETDLSNIKSVLTNLIPYLRKNQTLILRSTVAPQTTSYIRNFIELNSNLRVGKDLALAFCPERLAEHKAIEELKKLPQIIGCEDDFSFSKANEFFLPFNVKIFKTNYLSAELTKLFNNTSRYIDFAVANQFALIANNFNQNIYEILKLANEDYPRGYIYSPGFTAGTCLRKDFGMINELSPGPDLLLAAWKVNEFMPYHLIELASKHKPLNKSHIAVLGYTFKGNSDDTRDSLVPKLIRYLERQVPASLCICEPNIAEPKIEGYPNLELRSAIKNADVIFVATNHDEFKSAETILGHVKRGTLIIDIWNCLKQNKMTIIKV